MQISSKVKTMLLLWWDSADIYGLFVYRWEADEKISFVQKLSNLETVSSALIKDLDKLQPPTFIKFVTVKLLMNYCPMQHIPEQFCLFIDSLQKEIFSYLFLEKGGMLW